MLFNDQNAPKCTAIQKFVINFSFSLIFFHTIRNPMIYRIIMKLKINEIVIIVKLVDQLSTKLNKINTMTGI